MKMRITYREVLIVLIIVGLCFLIGWNIVSLHRFSVMREETARIEKISAALNVYHARLGKFPTETPYKIVAEMLEGGYLLREDFYSPLGRGYWNFIGCVNGWHENYFDIHYAIGNDSGICLYLSKELPNIENNYHNDATSTRLACYIESVIDDVNVKTGKGRGGAEFIIEHDGDATNCNKALSDDSSWYLFRVF